MTLILAVLIFSAACFLVIYYVIASGQHKKNLASVEERRQKEVDDKCRDSEKLEVGLVTSLIDGQPISASVQRWQTDRADLLPIGRTNKPWAWSPEDLAKWSHTFAAKKVEEFERAFHSRLLITAVATLLLTGLIGFGCYHFYARQGETAPVRSSDWSTAEDPFTQGVGSAGSWQTIDGDGDASPNNAASDTTANPTN